MITMELTQGDTVLWGGGCADEDGVAYDLTGYSLAAQLRGPDDALAGQFDCVVDPGTGGTFVVGASAIETQTWEPGLYRSQIEFTSAGGEVYSTETFLVRVVADVTRL